MAPSQLWQKGSCILFSIRYTVSAFFIIGKPVKSLNHSSILDSGSGHSPARSRHRDPPTHVHGWGKVGPQIPCHVEAGGIRQILRLRGVHLSSSGEEGL